jgi:flagellar biosynthesis GTPase FlhF
MKRYAIALSAFTAVVLVGTSVSAQGRDRDRRKNDRGQGPVVQSFSPMSGEPGTAVTIQGKDLADDTVIIIGQRQVPATRVTRRSLTFTVPSLRPGKRDIILRSSAGDVTVGQFDVIVARTPPPPPPPPGADGRITVPPPRRADRRGPPPHRQSTVVHDFSPHQGPVGTKVTIRGKRFAPDLTVLVGDRPVKPTRITDTEIELAVPRQHGNGLIVLRGIQGRRDLVVGTFEIARQPPPRDHYKRRMDERRERAKQRWAERRAALAQSEAERQRELERQEEELQRSREQRRRERAQALREKWEQDFLAQEEVRAEMALHAERMARLARMLRLAESIDQEKLVIRIEVATETENDRHERRMNALRAAFQRQ